MPFELRSSHHQFNVWGVPVVWGDRQAGDLVFFDIGQGQVMGNLAGHVGIMLDAIDFIHAANEELGVRIDPISADWYAPKLLGFRRIFDLAPEPVKVTAPPKPHKAPRRRVTLPNVWELGGWTLRTPNQWNGEPFPVTWEAVYHWRDELEAAARAEGVDVRVLAVKMMMETQGIHWRDGELLTVWDDFPEDGPAVGVMQLKPQVWGWLDTTLDPGFPAQNVMLAAKIHRHLLDEEGGDLEAAVRRWFPAKDPNGSTPDSYMRTFWGLMGELGYV